MTIRQKITQQRQATMMAFTSGNNRSRWQLPRHSLRFLTAMAWITTAAVIATPCPALAQETDDEAADPRQEGLPLAPGRTISTSFTEGSWMSVDVSPDGQTLVFDFLGDLYTLPIAGGTAVPLTQGMALDGQPRFSPDGARVAFTSDRSGGEAIHIIDVDMSDTVQVTKGKSSSYQSPEWTPDGKYVIGTKQGPGQGKLWMYHVDGGSGIQLIDEPENRRTTGAAFGSDDRRIWYAYRTGSWEYNSGMRQYQLAVYDRETGESATRSFRYGGAFRPALSPDGRWLVYGSRHIGQTGLRIRDLDNGDERWLAFPVQRDDQESRATRDAYPGMSFTPDSREVVAYYGGGLWRVPIDGSEPTAIPFRVDVEMAIGPEVDFDYPIEDTETFVAKQVRDAVPSPSGDRIAFSLLARVYVMDWPDGTPRRLTGADVNEHMPVWSPDGAAIAYTTWDDAEGGHIYRAESGGGDPERLTSVPALYNAPAWSPDGERILAIRGPGRAYDEALTRGVPGGADDLVWIPASGGETTVIGPARYQAHHFTDDPGRIYAYGAGDGLVSFRWDGTDRKQHVKVVGAGPPGSSTPPSASLVMMAPRGDQALARVVNHLYTVTVPVVGGDVPTVNVGNPENASFPARQLTEIGGEFPAWGHDGRTVHWTLGNAHLVYNLDDAQIFEDSVAAAARDEGDEEEDEGDEAGGDEDEEDDEAADDDDARYQPDEVRIRVAIPRDIPEGAVVLSGARVVTMAGDEVIESGDIVVVNNRITAVGATGSVTIPEGADVLDLAGKTVVPGYVDTHAHLRAQINILRSQPWSYAANLAYGVTTTRDPQTGTTDVVSYEDLVRAGRILSPRIYSTGPGVFSSENVKDLDHARDILRRYSDYYDTKSIKMYGAGNREQRQWIIEAARELELMPTTEGGLDTKVNMTMAIDGYSGMEHNMPGFPMYADMVELVARSTMAYTPTILVTYGGPWAENYFYATEDVLGDEKLARFTPFEEIQQKALRRPAGPGPSGWFHRDVHTFDQVSAFVRDIIRAGGRAGIGSHGQLQGLGYHWELWAMQSGGMTEHEALQVATIIGAHSLGLDGDLGSIEAGKLADLLILDGNPLDDIRNSNTVDRVMMNGRVYDGDTLDQVWPEQVTAGPFYWLREAPPEGE